MSEGAGDGHLRGRAYALELLFEDRPVGAWGDGAVGPTDLTIRLATSETIAGAWSGGGEVGWESWIDGAPFRVLRGRAGDHRFEHGERSLHHLSADGSALLRAAGGSDPLSWRICLDSVLFTASLLAGHESLHAASVVAGDGGAILVAGATGGGKSTLLAALLAFGRGWTMLSDDVTTLTIGATGGLMAHPGPPLATFPQGCATVPGEAIADLGGECWRAVPVAGEAQPLRALILLNRVPDLPIGLHRVGNPFADLMTGLLGFPRLPERERSRFEMAAMVADRIPVWRLDADTGVAPEDLAAAVRASI